MNGKNICLITGANSEIGIALAERFKNEYQLVLCWHQNCSRLKKHFYENNVDFMQADLQYEDSCKTVIDFCMKKYKKIDLMINCIGKNTSCSDDQISERDWDEVINSNLRSVFMLCKYFKKNMETFYFDRSDYCGCIINISSTAGIRALPSSPHYIAAKAGVIAISEYYSKVLAPYVRVNTIAPGFANTDKHCNKRYESIKAKIPMKRFAELNEIADTAHFLVGNKYITGQTIIIDGGLIS